MHWAEYKGYFSIHFLGYVSHPSHCPFLPSQTVLFFNFFLLYIHKSIGKSTRDIFLHTCLPKSPLALPRTLSPSYISTLSLWYNFPFLLYTHTSIARVQGMFLYTLPCISHPLHCLILFDFLISQHTVLVNAILLYIQKTMDRK